MEYHRGCQSKSRARCGIGAILLCWLALATGSLRADEVPVLHPEGITHGYLVLRTLEGQVLAAGDLIQNVKGDRVTSELVFHFKDGSIHQETTVFSQRHSFRLLSDHLVDKGPTFRHPIDVSLDGSSGQITVTYAEDDGQEKVLTDRMKLPGDVANGIVLILLKNIRRSSSQIKVSMVAATPKPRIVKLNISSAGEETFSIAGSEHKAMHYVIKVEIGGVAGVVAPIVGKQPPDTHVWIEESSAPTFVRLEGPLFEGGPVWRIELTSPIWPDDSKKETRHGSSR
jgi:hypothetical protein